MKLITDIRACALFLIIAFAIALFPEMGCATEGDLFANLRLGQEKALFTIEHGGLRREFYVYLPLSLASQRGIRPVLFVFHGYGNNVDHSYKYGFNREAEEHGFVVIYPSGVDQAWNAGLCCGARKTDDVGFVESIIDRAVVSDTLRIDRDRIYATGFSNGGMMSYRLACESDRFAAIAPVSGSFGMQIQECRRKRPISILHVHGLLDGIVRFCGGSPRTTPSVVLRSIPETFKEWERINFCSESAWMFQKGFGRERNIAVYDNRNCGYGAELQLVVLRMGIHWWPIGSPGLSTATSYIVDFLLSKSLVPYENQSSPLRGLSVATRNPGRAYCALQGGGLTAAVSNGDSDVFFDGDALEEGYDSAQASGCVISYGALSRPVLPFGAVLLGLVILSFLCVMRRLLNR